MKKRTLEKAMLLIFGGKMERRKTEEGKERKSEIDTL